MPRILLLVATQSYRAGAFLAAAAHVGAEVTVGSDRPQALAAAHPAGHLVLDFAAPEVSAGLVADFARRHPLDAVVAADDDGVLLAARAAMALGLRHNAPAAVEAARDKHRARQRWAQAGLAGPRFEVFDLARGAARVACAAADRIGFPCVAKPLALAASRGVIRANDVDGLWQALLRLAAIVPAAPGAASPARFVLIEEYVPGAEFALEGLLSAGHLRPLALFDKPDPLEGPFFEETIYLAPSRLAAPTQEAILDHVSAATRALGLSDGPLHAELRVGDRGPVMLEVAPRPIGGLCSRALRFVGAGRDDVSLEELLLRHALGEDVQDFAREPSASGVMMIPIPRAGILRGVDGIEAARAVPGVDEVRITIPTGDRLVPWPEGSRYLGFIFARAGLPERAEAALRAAHAALRFDVEPPG
jgi:biotin carboxylase